MIKQIIFSLTILFITLIHASAQTDVSPVVLWVSSPVKPGETVLVHGGNFSSNAVVKVKQGWKNREIKPLSTSETALMFVFPDKFKESSASAIIESDGKETEPFLINAPAPWWIQGDQGREASCISGSISIFGNCLTDADDEPFDVTLKCIEGIRKGKRYSIETARFDPYSIRSQKWDKIPEGLYEVILDCDGGTGDIIAGTIRISPVKKLIPDAVFNIRDFGAIPNDGIDDTDAIIAATSNLTEKCGGTLFIPRGRFQMARTIELPPFSALRGQGADLSQIYWSDTFEPLPALVKGSHSFEVSDIFLTCGNHKDGIVSAWPQPGLLTDSMSDGPERCGDITVRNITLRMLYSQYVNSDMDELKRRLPPLHYSRALRLGGENVKVINNDIYCAAGGLFELKLIWSEVSGNTLSRGNIIGWNGFSGQQLIFENNHLGGANCTSFYGLPEGSENIYWGHNFHENNFDGNNRETITGDGRVHAYMDNVENITPISFTLKSKPDWRYGVDAWKNGAVQIAGGKGVGQIRRIKAITENTIELESPWTISPDEKSVINISSFRRRFIYTGNRAYDSTVALQLYGSTIEGIIAGNITSRTGGYNGDAMSGEANWFNQFLDNTIETGNSYRGPRNQVPPLDGQLGLLAYGTGTGSHKYPLVRSCVVRNNNLKSAAHLTVMGWVVDCLLENNRIANADIGAKVSSDARNIVLHGNSFDNVEKPYEYEEKSVVIRPAEELIAAMNGTATQMEWVSVEEMPAGWNDIFCKLKDCQITGGEVMDLWQKVIKAFADKAGNSAANGKVIETLTGVTIETPNWRTAYPVTQGVKAATAPLLIRIPQCRVKAHLKLWLETEDPLLTGWSMTIPEFDLEPGKLADSDATITKPEGNLRMVKIPLSGTLTGDNWKINFTTEISDPWEAITLDKFKVSRPMDNPLAEQKNIGYIPYNRIPKVSNDQLIEAPMDHGRFNFEEFFKDPENEGRLIYGSAALKIKAPVKVRFQMDRNSLLYVNGEIIGTTLGRGQWGFTNLHEGENRIELLMLPSKRSSWKMGIPRITWSGKAMELQDN